MIQPSDLPEAAWARDLARLDDDQIRINLKHLPAERQADLVLSAGWKERLRLIKNSDLAAEVVRVLPEEEVLLTIKGAGEEDSLPLLALTTPGQLRFILDVELWKRDSIDEDKAVAWLDYILACGEDKVIAFVRDTEMELLSLLLRKFVALIPNEEGVGLTEGLPSIMPDEFFTIVSKLPDQTEKIKLLLRIVRQDDRDLFYKMLFEAYGCPEHEAEEEAFRWRTSRLEAHGMLDFDEAVEIYGYIGEEEAKSLAWTLPHLYYPEEDAGTVAPAYPVLLNRVKGFFADVLASIEDRAVQNRLRHEITFSVNRLLVADAEHIGEIDSIKKAIERLFSLANLGLVFLAGSDKAQAARILRDVAVRDVFQIGFSRAVDLKNQASDVTRRWWPGWAQEGFTFLDFPHAEILRGLLMRVPQYYAAVEGGVEFRDFRTMEEICAAGNTVATIAAVAEACFEKLGLPRPSDAKLSLDRVFATGIEDITLRNLIMTGFVRFSLGHKFDITPLSREDVGEVFRRLLEAGSGGGRRIKRETTLGFLDYLSRATGFEVSKFQLLGCFVEESLDLLEGEIGRVASPRDIDPRYVRSLIVAR